MLWFEPFMGNMQKCADYPSNHIMHESICAYFKGEMGVRLAPINAINSTLR